MGNKTAAKKSSTYWQKISDHVFLVDRFIQDCPGFRPLFDSLNMPNDLDAFVSRADVKNTLGERFNAIFTIHQPGKIMSDLARFIPDFAPLSGLRDNKVGFMIRHGKDDSCRVAIAWVGTKNKLHRGTVLHEFGHYVEQRVAALRGYSPGPTVDRDTAIRYAREVINKMIRPSHFAGNTFIAADEVVAWLNAVWLCWILGIDPRIVIAEMAIDSVSSPENDSGFVKICSPLINHIITDHSSADRMFKSAGPFTFQQALERKPGETDITLCQQIDGATASILEYILVRLSNGHG
ncbi:MAG: hypothetical protein HY847_02445 [Betaproteobacteria bacterium]|nr:hypothetical protein [Betaproteobacteria bacterium]